MITGCESPLAWCLARKLDEIGFTVFAGFTKRTGSADADLLKEESSGRTKIIQLDVTSETQVTMIFTTYQVCACTYSKKVSNPLKAQDTPLVSIIQYGMLCAQFNSTEPQDVLKRKIRAALMHLN